MAFAGAAALRYGDAAVESGCAPFEELGRIDLRRSRERDGADGRLAYTSLELAAVVRKTSIVPLAGGDLFQTVRHHRVRGTPAVGAVRCWPGCDRLSVGTANVQHDCGSACRG